MFHVVTGMLCGFKTWEDIEIFGEENLDWFRKFSDYSQGVPSHDTIARIIGMIEPEEFTQCFTRWCNDIRAKKSCILRMLPSMVKAYEAPVITVKTNS